MSYRHRTPLSDSEKRAMLQNFRLLADVQSDKEAHVQKPRTISYWIIRTLALTVGLGLLPPLYLLFSGSEGSFWHGVLLGWTTIGLILVILEFAYSAWGWTFDFTKPMAVCMISGVLLIIIGFALPLFLAGDWYDWENGSLSTLAAYERYIKQHPQGKHVEEARHRIEGFISDNRQRSLGFDDYRTALKETLTQEAEAAAPSAVFSVQLLDAINELTPDARGWKYLDIVFVPTGPWIEEYKGHFDSGSSLEINKLIGDDVKTHVMTQLDPQLSSPINPTLLITYSIRYGDKTYASKDYPAQTRGSDTGRRSVLISGRLSLYAKGDVSARYTSHLLNTESSSTVYSTKRYAILDSAYHQLHNELQKLMAAGLAKSQSLTTKRPDKLHESRVDAQQ